MTATEFRGLALDFPEAIESAHMGHPDFRVRGKIFATLGPDEDWGMAKLTPDQQATFVRTDPAVFQPIAGGWGQRGYTRIDLARAAETSVRQALTLAWKNTAPRRLAQEWDEA